MITPRRRVPTCSLERLGRRVADAEAHRLGQVQLDVDVRADSGRQVQVAREVVVRLRLVDDAQAQLGRDLEDALQAMAQRLQSEDLSWATEAIAIHREIGGDLAQLLEQVSTTVREREMIRRQIDVLSAEGRISAIVLLALPVFLAFVTWTIAPDYLGELTRLGQAMGFARTGNLGQAIRLLQQELYQEPAASDARAADRSPDD